MGVGFYRIYNVAYTVSYVPFWESTNVSLSSEEFTAKLYWVNDRGDIKCDMLGNFVEPSADDRCIEGELREGKSAVLWARSECLYPVTVTATGWSYRYPNKATSNKSKRTEAYQKTTERYSVDAQLGGYPENGPYMEGGVKYWSVLDTVKTTNKAYFKNESGAWLPIEMYVCTNTGWIPIERVEVMCVGWLDTDGVKDYWTW